MAALNTQQKAAVIIKDFYGTELSSLGATTTLSPEEGVLSAKNVNNVITLTAVAPGDCTVTVTKAGSTGTLDVTVTAAPLTLTLGTPEPK